MKWFHHECAAKHDPKLQTLGDEFGAEGLGIYWGLLEEIGLHSDTFHLKVSGVAQKADNNFNSLTKGSERVTMNCFPSDFDARKMPQLSVRLLAKNLFTSPEKLPTVLDAAVTIGLFDSSLWLKYKVLYSPAFEQRADEYTRRQQRRPDNVRTKSEEGTNNVRTNSGQSSDKVRRKSDFVRREAEQKRTEEEQNSMLTCTPGENVDNLCYQNPAVDDSEFLIVPTPEQFEFYRQKLTAEIVAWNEGRRNRFEWQPTVEELKKLFFSGGKQHKISLCYQAYNLNRETINYPELVLRAVRLMLRSSVKKRIQNPTGWLWSCLHGNGDGTTPWVQLLTADEENSTETQLRRITSPRSCHPP